MPTPGDRPLEYKVIYHRILYGEWSSTNNYIGVDVITNNAFINKVIRCNGAIEKLVYLMCRMGVLQNGRMYYVWRKGVVSAKRCRRNGWDKRRRQPTIAYCATDRSTRSCRAINYFTEILEIDIEWYTTNVQTQICSYLTYNITYIRILVLYIACKNTKEIKMYL